jgi:hypothetical protein
MGGLLRVAIKKCFVNAFLFFAREKCLYPYGYGSTNHHICFPIEKTIVGGLSRCIGVQSSSSKILATGFEF